MRIDKRLKPLRHVIESVRERVKLVLFEDSISFPRLADTGAQVALRQLARRFAQTGDGASENEHEDKCCQAADGDGYG